MCYNPQPASRQETGRPLPDSEGDLRLPCGKCPECISIRASDWALRVKHELGDHDHNTFLTLTYDDNNLPSFFDRKVAFQNFMKRLRKSIGSKKIKYLVSHEFGSQTARIHHHAILFGYSFSKPVFLRNSPKGYPLYTSKSLERFWPHGYHSIGEANPQTAYYIAAYALKKTTVETVDPTSGEVITLTDCLGRSNGIGLNYFKRNHPRMLAYGERLPRYYQKKLEQLYPHLFLEYQNQQASLRHEVRSETDLYSKVLIDSQKYTMHKTFRASTLTKTDYAKLHFFKPRPAISQDS